MMGIKEVIKCSRGSTKAGRDYRKTFLTSNKIPASVLLRKQSFHTEYYSLKKSSDTRLDRKVLMHWAAWKKKKIIITPYRNIDNFSNMFPKTTQKMQEPLCTHPHLWQENILKDISGCFVYYWSNLWPNHFKKRGRF